VAANPTRSITANILSATLIDDVDTPLPEEVDESGGVDDEAPLEVVVEHVMSGNKYVREGYIIGPAPNGSLMVPLTSFTRVSYREITLSEPHVCSMPVTVT